MTGGRPTPPLVLLKATCAQFTELRPHETALLDLSCGDDAEEEEVSDVLTSTVPAKSIAAGARRKAVLDRTNATVAPLDDVIHLPVAIHVLGPTAAIEVQAIAAKMAVTAGLVEYLPQRCLPHGTVPITNGALAASGAVAESSPPRCLL
jgi:hypothetical protein